MFSPARNRLALLVAGLGFSVAVAAAGPKDKDSPPAKATPPAKVEVKPPVDLPKLDPKPAVGLPKFDPKPAPLPAKLDPKPTVTLPKPDPKPLPLPSKLDPKPEPKPTLPIGTPVLPKVTPKPTLPIGTPEAKPPVKPEHRPIVIHEKPKPGGPADLPKGPGLKLPAGTKIDHTDLAKIKPPIDLTKTKPEVVLKSKPPSDFKVKPIKLDSIHVPKDAPAVEKLNVTNVSKLTVNNTFVVNKSFYTGGDYHLKFGTKTAAGFFCYAGKHHCHWHHCIWDPCFGCHYYYCPSACCYYYWCEAEYCYYPCHWFVDYGTCYYPWWICGGFGGYGYVGTPFVSIHIGW
jgi:hypothetical protein